MDPDSSPKTAILVADDQEPVGKKVSSMLEKAGFVVLSAANGPAALELCRRKQQAVDLAVIDAATAQMQLTEMAQQLNEISPRLLFLSDDDANTSGVALGRARRVLRKPVRMARLLGNVLEMMEEPLVLRAGVLPARHPSL
jgi:CheY-like chemotaxis protein